MAAKKKSTRKKSTRKKTSTKRRRSSSSRARKATTRDRDPRLPAVGKTIVREFKGRSYELKVTADGFALGDMTFKSLTAAARAITGYDAVSGWAFFHLTKRTQKGGA